jgi:transforming growth factor-beta-induced protein
MQCRRVIGIIAAGAVAAPVAAGAAPALAHSGSAPAGVAAASGSETIVQVAAGDARFTTLVKLVKAAGLAETLSSGSYTVFAPTDAAFAKVPKKTLAALAKNKAKLKAVLLYHVVAGEVPASKVVKLKSAKTLNGASVKISVRGKTVRLNRTAKVVQADVMASNGIVHVINRVLLPPSR